MKTKDKIDQLIESAIDQVLATNLPFRACDVKEVLLADNPLLSNSMPDNLDRRIERCLDFRFDSVRRAEIITEDFLNGRPWKSLNDTELEAYCNLQRELGEELTRHGEALKAYVAQRDGGTA